MSWTMEWKISLLSWRFLFVWVWLVSYMVDSGIMVVNAFATIKSRSTYSQDTRVFATSEEKGDVENNGRMMNRRSVMMKSGVLSSSLLLGLPQINYAVEDDDGMFASWSAVDGLNSELEGVVTFNPSAYRAMKEDSSRTPLFKQAIIDRLYHFIFRCQTYQLFISF